MKSEAATPKAISWFRKRLYCPFVFVWLFTSGLAFGQSNQFYVTNQYPLKEQPYTALPLGSIKAKGWLLKMLELQRDGLTGNLDEAYSEVCGDSNAWLGGNGDAWERGPYWLDGLVPLAYLLDDKGLQQKAQKWVEWSINNQREDGYFGPRPPATLKPRTPGIQDTLHQDWWPKMVMLKVLQQYYSATEDDRVVKLMTNYFRYMHQKLPTEPLNHWSFWAAQRGADNLAVVYWLYNLTKQPFLLELGDLIYKQTTPWSRMFTDGTFATLNPYPNVHCVNLAQGLKAPVIRFQRSGDSTLLHSVKEGLQTIRNVHGFANGMYGGDEGMHGNVPTQGSEYCSAVEMMFSFESMIPVTGDVFYADYLEKIAFNVLPSQHNDDFKLRQYFQQANQINVTYPPKNFFNNDQGRQVFGLLAGFPCCTANMHQGYPKYVQNLWYATKDNGLAALVYGASEVSARVAGNKLARFTQETNYPFEEEIRFTYTSSDKATFPLHLRIPAWCKEALIEVNGQTHSKVKGNQVVVVKRSWKKGDRLTLQLPMNIHISRWNENSAAVERGPILFGLEMEEDWKPVTNSAVKNTFYEVYSSSPWNYGLPGKSIDSKRFTVEKAKNVSDMPWNLQAAPIRLKVQARRIPGWKEYNGSAGPMPRSRVSPEDAGALETISLVPYGCTALRISQFPVVAN